jgi:hypothetical protein
MQHHIVVLHLFCCFFCFFNDFLNLFQVSLFISQLPIVIFSQLKFAASFALGLEACWKLIELFVKSSPTLWYYLYFVSFSNSFLNVFLNLMQVFISALPIIVCCKLCIDCSICGLKFVEQLFPNYSNTFGASFFSQL